VNFGEVSWLSAHLESIAVLDGEDALRLTS